jgi:hypothetical protein
MILTACGCPVGTVSAYALTCIAAYVANNYTTTIDVGASVGFGRGPPVDYGKSPTGHGLDIRICR